MGIALADYLLFRHGSRLAPALAPEVGRWVAPAVTLTLLGFAAGSRRAGPWLLLALLALGGWRNLAVVGAGADPDLERAASANAAIVLCGRLTEVITRPDGGWQARLERPRLVSGQGYRRTTARLRLSGDARVTPPADGEEWLVRLRPTRPAAPTNPGEYDQRRRLLRQGYFYRATVRRPEECLARRPPPRVSAGAALNGLRRAMGRSIDRRLEGFAGRFTRVLLIGDRVSFRPEEEAEFRTAGVTHILSVSGLHVGLVAATVQLLLGRRRRWNALALTLGGIWIYTLLVGAPSAAVRSAAMLTLALLGRHFGRPVSGPALLSGATFVLLVLEPALLFDLGFVLSVMSVGGLLAAHDLLGRWNGLERLPGFARKGVEALALTFGAQAATAPFTLPPWGDWPLVAPLGNLLVVGLSDFVLTGGLVALALDLALPRAADQTFAAVWALTRAVQFGVHLLASNSPGVTGLPPPPPGVVPLFLALTAGLMLAVRAGARRSRRVALSVAWVVAFVLLVAAPRLPPRTLRLTQIDVGQGDATLIEFPDGATLLIDAGEGGARDTGRRFVLPVLRDLRLRRLDAVAISHQHHDHIGGLFAVLGGFRVRRVFDTGLGPAAGEPRELQELSLRRGAPACLVAAGDTLLAGPDYAVTALWPPRPSAPGDAYVRPGNVLNNLSLILAIDWRGHRIILPGDAQRLAEGAVAARIPAGPIDYLKAAHHGSHTSNTAVWLTHLRPRLFGVPVGDRNKFRHPSPDVLARCDSLGIPILRNDREGALRLTWERNGFRWRTWGNGRTQAPREGFIAAPDGAVP